MAALRKSRRLLQKPDRRCFLWSLAGLGLAAKTPKSEKRSEPVYLTRLFPEPALGHAIANIDSIDLLNKRYLRKCTHYERTLGSRNP
jgi:hypothetical protein